MLIHSTRFGDLNVPESHLFHFPDGLPGFPEEKLFAFLPYAANSPFAFLQSAQEPNLTFVVVETFQFFPDYQFEIDDAAAENLGLLNGAKPAVYSLVTISQRAADVTANLLAPIVVNPETRRARQIVLEGSCYTTKHRLFNGELPAQENTAPQHKGGR